MAAETLTETGENIPIACLLPEDGQQQRAEEIGPNLLAFTEEVRELSDGYEYRFPGDIEWAEKLIEFIREERACCPFFTFEIRFEPASGPIWLALRGPEGTKEFIASFGQ